MLTDSEKYRVAQESRKLMSDAVKACMEGSVQELESSLDKFISTNPSHTADDFFIGFQSEGRTLLHIAASGGHASVFAFIRSKCRRIDNHVNLRDDKGFTPLIYATIAECNDVIVELLAMGADPAIRNNDGAAAIHFAAGDGNVQRMQLLHTASAKNPEIERALLEQQSSKAGAPIHWAAGKARSKAIKFLIECGVDVNATNAEGLPPVLLAAVASCDEGVQALVEAGADVGMIVSGNLTLLHICAEHGLVHSVTSIVQNSGDTGLRCCSVLTFDGKNSPLHLAAMAGHKEIVHLLLPYTPHHLVSQIPGLENISIVSAEDVSEEDVQLVLQEGSRRMQIWHDLNKNNADQNDSNDKKHVSNGNQAAVSTSKTKTSQSATSEDKLSAEKHKNTGNEFFKQKRYEDAVKEYEVAISLDSTNAAYWSNRSACYLSIAERPGITVEDKNSLLSNALHDAEQCRRLRPDWVKGCYRLAAARLALKQYEDAALAAFEGVKLDQHNQELKSLLQQCVKCGQDEYRKQQSQKQDS